MGDGAVFEEAAEQSVYSTDKNRLSSEKEINVKDQLDTQKTECRG